MPRVEYLMVASFLHKQNILPLPLLSYNMGQLLSSLHLRLASDRVEKHEEWASEHTELSLNPYPASINKTSNEI